MDTKVLSQYKNPLIGLAIVLIFAILAQGIFSHYSLKKNEIAAKMRELEEGEQTIEEWEKLRSEIEKLSLTFLTKDTLFFKKFVEEKANALGIEITSLKTSSVEKDLYWEVTMLLGMHSSYKRFIDFIKAIEEKSVVAEKIKITSDQDARDETIEVTLKGFVVK